MLSHTGNQAEAGALSAIDALSDILHGVRRDLARSRSVLSGAFGQIAARFAQVHAIAVAAEARDADTPHETLRALRETVDALTIELQFEDALSQLLEHVAGKVEAVGVALNETRAMVTGETLDAADPPAAALEVLARTVKSIQLAADAGPGSRSEAKSGSIDLF